MITTFTASNGVFSNALKKFSPEGKIFFLVFFSLKEIFLARSYRVFQIQGIVDLTSFALMRFFDDAQFSFYFSSEGTTEHHE